MLIYYSNNFTLFNNETPVAAEIDPENPPATPPVLAQQKKPIAQANFQVI